MSSNTDARELELMQKAQTFMEANYLKEAASCLVAAADLAGNYGNREAVTARYERAGRLLEELAERSPEFLRDALECYEVAGLSRDVARVRKAEEAYRQAVDMAFIGAIRSMGSAAAACHQPQ